MDDTIRAAFKAEGLGEVNEWAKRTRLLLERLFEDNARYKAALEFYAVEKNYPTYYPTRWLENINAVPLDKGRKAREALAGKGE